MGQDLVKEQSINGRVYRVRMLDPDSAWDMLVDLFDMLGPAGAALVGGSDQDGASDASLERALSQLSGHLNKEKVRGIIQRLARVSEVCTDNGKSLPLGEAYRVHFSGRIGEMLQWLIFAVKSQYADFSGAVGSIPGLGTSRHSTPTADQ